VVILYAVIIESFLASGGCQPTELIADDSEGSRHSARRGTILADKQKQRLLIIQQPL